ncbi:MAG: phosphonate ABC transporter, permease protein PhnE [Candidatus Cloacimonetes bacterium]|nr:phosphonate ABC transporter, permease protein PhnE [Candidatus Cloacimonadota bacterium]
MKRIYAVLIDILAFGYILGSIVFLLQQIFDFSLQLLPLILLSLILTLICLFLEDSLGLLIFGFSAGKKYWHSFSGWLITVMLILTFICGWIIVEINPLYFFEGINNTRGILQGLFSPNFQNLLPMLSALAETIYLALLATIFALPFAFAFSFLAARNLMPNTFWGNSIYIFIRTLATFFRSVEAIIWAIIFCVWVGIGPFAGMLALMIHSIASLTKLFSEQIENIDQGPVEAITGTGASTLQIWLYAVIPQIVSPFLAFTIYRWDINVRMATIVGFVGGGGIGLALQQEQQMLRWHNVGLIIWLIAITIWIMDMVSGKVRARLMEL